ncbi:cytochrome P450 [Mycena rosella]|uniref:Cytochrome P450 n=1 Tax=Mycena rosella TaxID=1033263 RepID=A0AAD7MB43_MYCRO|nr:cytochrome P450 [Mycena rosella]
MIHYQICQIFSDFLPRVLWRSPPRTLAFCSFPEILPPATTMSPLVSALFGPLCGVLVVSCVFLLRLISNRSRLPLPPGPKKLPLVGNLFDMPAEEEWETYQKWSRDFDSDIIHLNVAGKSIIILSSLEATNDLMVQRSAIYSDRPRFPMVNELMGWEFSLGFMKYGRRWRAERKIFNTAFSVGASSQFQPMELASTHGMLRRILKSPDSCMLEQIDQMTGGLIMSIAYGIDVLPTNDPYIKLARESMEGLALGGVPGKYLVDAIPALKYIPAWLPGAGFKREALEWRKVTQQSVVLPFEEAKRKIATGKAPTSFVSNALSMEWPEHDPDYSEDSIRDTAGTIFNAGSHTTVSVLGTFMLAMLRHPEIQKKAQMEIDLVVGRDRLPTLEDKPALQYITALVKELLRWKPVVPLSPHFVAVEDEYRGYRIPAGSIVLGNTWAILNDEALYPAPLKFHPERFLSAGQRDGKNPDPEWAFGYGRRACPGKFMALDNLWITVASLLAVFDISKAVGEDGNVIEPTYKYCTGLVCMPLPFKSSIRPRSKRSAELVEATAL